VVGGAFVFGEAAGDSGVGDVELCGGVADSCARPGQTARMGRWTALVLGSPTIQQREGSHERRLKRSDQRLPPDALIWIHISLPDGQRLL